MADETHEIRLKRLNMRSQRRGIREMDLILGGFAARHLGALAPGELDMFESLLSENDHDLYAWVSGRMAPPRKFAPLIARISADTGS